MRTSQSYKIIFLFFIVSLSIMFYTTVKFLYLNTMIGALREVVGEPESDWTIFYLVGLGLVSIFVIILAYIFLFKIDERRKKLIGPLLPVACIFLLEYQNIWMISMAAITLIILTGWLYPTRKRPGIKHEESTGRPADNSIK